MTDTKGLFQSKTFWGAVIAMIAMVLKLAGYDLGDHEGTANDIMALVGSVIAIYGRAAAVKKISGGVRPGA